MSSSSQTQYSWSSKIGFILATTGAAVGMGNIWKFPYMAGDNGGGAFVLIYLLATFFIGIPIMMAEILIGRMGRQNAVDTMVKLGGSRWFGSVAWMGALGLLLILALYSAISGWSIAYLFKSLQGELVGLSANGVAELWTQFLSDPLELLFWHTIFISLTILVLVCGVQQGLERASKIMMPGLFIILLILVGYAITTGEISQAATFLLQPDFSKLTPQVLLQALGHTFFALAVGAGCVLVYGAYVPQNTNLGRSVCTIALLNLAVAILAGFSIFPLVFAHGLSPAEGPALMFKVLPVAFAVMPFGQLFGSLFFILLWFAAWTSAFSMAEPLLLLLEQKYQLSRRRAAVYILLLGWLIGISVILSFNWWSDLNLLGKYTPFELIDIITTQYILPIGALVYTLFAGYKINAIQQELNLGLESHLLFKLWRGLVRYLCPVIITVIFVYSFINS